MEFINITWNVNLSFGVLKEYWLAATFDDKGIKIFKDSSPTKAIIYPRNSTFIAIDVSIDDADYFQD